MLFNELDKLKRNVIMTSIVLMFAGLLLIIIPYEYIPFISIALGFGLLVACVFSVFSFISSRKVIMRYVALCAGLFLGLLGVALWIFDDMFLTLLSWLVGCVPIFIGLYAMFHAFVYARRSGRRGWWLMVLLSAALIVFGAVIFAIPRLRAENTIIQVTGGVMLSCSFISTLRLIWLFPVKPE